MLTIRRLLFPTDFSEGSKQALPQAVFLAKTYEAELHIVHATEQCDATDASLPVAADTLAEWLSADSASDLDALSIVQEHISADTPAEAICGYAATHDVDLAVMGTHGRRGTDRLIFGSVAEEVVREAPCPVLTVRKRDEDAPAQAVQQVLVPVDFSAFSEAAVRHARAIAATYDAEIHLLHVVEVPEHPPPHINPDEYPQPAVLDQAELDLEKLADEHVGHAVTVAATGGDPSDSILAYVDEHGIDLVVTATKGRTGLDQLLIGSVAEQVLRQSPVPVFVVKPDQKSIVSLDAQEVS